MSAPTMTGNVLDEARATIKGADSVELKLTVAEEQQRSTALALGMDPLQAQIRLVTFFDTPALDLDRAGLVVRARRIQGKTDDSIVKLRPVVPDELPKKFRRSPNFRVEVDALPGGFVCSATMKGGVRSTDVQDAMRGTRPLRKLFSKEQRKVFASKAPEGLELDDLTPLGPIIVLKLKFPAPEVDRRLVAELWMYPDGSRLLELSTRTKTSEAFDAAAELRSYLEARGVDLSAAQETKTRKALQFFARDAG